MTVVRSAALAALLMYALSSFAALAPRYQEWGSGPVRWIMTREEQKQWKEVTTDN